MAQYAQLPDLTAAMAGMQVDLSPLQKFAQQQIAQEKEAHRRQVEAQQLAMQQAAADRAAAEYARTGQQRGEIKTWATGQAGQGVPAALTDIAGITGDPSAVQNYVVAEAKRKAALNGPEEFGKAGAVFQNPDGTFSAIQFGSKATLKTHQLGQGVAPAKGITNVGDEIVSNATGQPVRNVAPQIANRETAKEVGEARGKFQASIPKLMMGQQSLEAKNALVAQEVDRALKLADSWTSTGLTGNVARGIPGTDAFALKQAIQTIKGNIGFETLQQMRAESPTGGALGQVAVQELEYLQSVLGSLDQAQTAEDIKRNLTRIKSFMAASATRRRRALEMDLQRFGGVPASEFEAPRFDPGGAPPKLQGRPPQDGEPQGGFSIRKIGD